MSPPIAWAHVLMGFFTSQKGENLFNKVGKMLSCNRATNDKCFNLSQVKRDTRKGQKALSLNSLPNTTCNKTIRNCCKK